MTEEETPTEQSLRRATERKCNEAFYEATPHNGIIITGMKLPDRIDSVARQAFTAIIRQGMSENQEVDFDLYSESCEEWVQIFEREELRIR